MKKNRVVRVMLEAQSPEDFCVLEEFLKKNAKRFAIKDLEQVKGDKKFRLSVRSMSGWIDLTDELVMLSVEKELRGLVRIVNLDNSKIDFFLGKELLDSAREERALGNLFVQRDICMFAEDLLAGE